MATEPSSSGLSNADKERIHLATNAIVSRSVYSKLVRLVSEWKAEEESRRTVLRVLLPVGVVALIIFGALVVWLLVPAPKGGTPPKGPHTLFPGPNAATPVKEYANIWRNRSQAALARVCVPMPSYFHFTAYINSSGLIERVEIERSTGNPETDRQLQHALRTAGPFPTFSAELRALADVLAFRESVRASGEKCSRP